MHRFNKYVVCVEMDCHHDVSVALLGCEWERLRLVGMNQVGEVLIVEETVAGFGDWDLNFDPDCLVFYNFLQCLLFC
jgi:hypothetical protein